MRHYPSHYRGDVDADDAGVPDVVLLRDSTHTAHKQYRCDHCGDAILPGERYRYVVLVVDGDLEVTRYHETPCTHPAERDIV